MSQISEIQNPWRALLLSQPASFRGVVFYVETGVRSSGRRVVSHEYPKRDSNYVEDMGRAARRFTFTGYLVYRPQAPATMAPYTMQRNLLIRALEAADPGQLVHPVFCSGTGMQAMCERYSMSESRERGGYTAFDMQFVEAGQSTSLTAFANTAALIRLAADAVSGMVRALG